MSLQIIAAIEPAYYDWKNRTCCTATAVKRLVRNADAIRYSLTLTKIANPGFLTYQADDDARKIVFIYTFKIDCPELRERKFLVEKMEDHTKDNYASGLVEKQLVEDYN